VRKRFQLFRGYEGTCKGAGNRVLTAGGLVQPTGERRGALQLTVDDDRDQDSTLFFTLVDTTGTCSIAHALVTLFTIRLQELRKDGIRHGMRHTIGQQENSKDDQPGSYFYYHRASRYYLTQRYKLPQSAGHCRFRQAEPLPFVGIWPGNR